jgi:hypothetical protein
MSVGLTSRSPRSKDDDRKPDNAQKWYGKGNRRIDWRKAERDGTEGTVPVDPAGRD